MGRKFIPEAPSPYYPPRARGYAVFFYIGNAIRRRLALDRLVLPREMKMSGLLAGFFVPGLAVVLRGPKTWGQIAMSASAFLFFFYIVFLGYPVANMAFGLMISLHSTGFIYYCNPVLVHAPLRSRLGFTVLVLLGLMLLIYWPARSLIQNHWLAPLRLNGHAIVVQRFLPKQPIQRGDWVAYTLSQENVGENYHNGTVWVHGGLSFGPVLALAGDRVTFSNNCYSVNGNWHTNLPHMPIIGELVVTEKHWFIWPNLDISGHGNVGEARVSAALMGLSDVTETNFYGKPFSRWFWRKQILP